VNFAAFSLHFTSFVAIDVYGGTADVASASFAQFELGMRAATSVLLLSAVIAALSGHFVIPILNHKFGVRCTFFVGELSLHSLLLLLLFPVPSRHRMLLITCVAVCYGVSLQIHYSNVFIIVEHELRARHGQHRAYVLSVINLAICFANVAVSAIISLKI